MKLKLAQSLLKPFGYQLARYSRFEEMLRNLRAHRDPFTFVQIGANDGILFDNLYYFVTEHHCRGLVVEPLQDYFERLSLNYKHYPAIKPVKVAMHPTERKCTLHRVNPASLALLPNWTAGIASFDPGHHAKLAMPAEHMLAEEVECMPLMELLRTHGIDALDLLQIDTEGFDAEVIRMIDFDTVTPTIIKYESVSLSPADSADVRARLGARGYRLFVEGGDTIAYQREAMNRIRAAA